MDMAPQTGHPWRSTGAPRTALADGVTRGLYTNLVNISAVIGVALVANLWPMTPVYTDSVLIVAQFNLRVVEWSWQE